MDWFLSQSEVDGYINHLWNGITTYHFSKICQGIIREGIELPNIQHVVPRDVVNKYGLLNIIKEEYGVDIRIRPKESSEAIDRTLSTIDPELNKRIWQAAGYSKPPTIRKMIKELYENSYYSGN